MAAAKEKTRLQIVTRFMAPLFLLAAMAAPAPASSAGRKPSLGKIARRHGIASPSAAATA
jgi:hypothetical protein